MDARREPGPLGLTRARMLLLGATILGVAALLVVLLGQDAEEPGPAAQATSAPRLLDIELDSFDGGPVSLRELAAGQPMVVNFFASWCGPCVREMPGFEAVHSRRSGDVKFLGVSLQDTAAAATGLAEQTGVTYDLVRDDDGELFRAVDGFSMPTTVFLDAEGRIVDIHGGELSQRDLEARIDRLVAS